jgi:hypothetical protein
MDVLIDAVETPPIYSEKPYSCCVNQTCRLLTFKDREKFRRHMNKHGIMIPYKVMNKRKVDEINPDGIVVLKEFKRYYTNLFFILIDYLTKLKLG